MASERHRRLTALAAKRRIARGEMQYQQPAMDEAVTTYMRIIGELAEEARQGGGWLDDWEARVDRGLQRLAGSVSYELSANLDGFQRALQELSEQMTGILGQMSEPIPVPPPPRPPPLLPPPPHGEWWRQRR